MQFLSGVYPLLFSQSAVYQQDQFQNAAESLLLPLLLPLNHALPAGVLTEQNLQLKSGLSTFLAAPMGSCRRPGQKRGETALCCIGLGFIDLFQHLFHQHQKLAETLKGLTASIRTVKPALKDAILILKFVNGTPFPAEQ